MSERQQLMDMTLLTFKVDIVGKSTDERMLKVTQWRALFFIQEHAL